MASTSLPSDSLKRDVNSKGFYCYFLVAPGSTVQSSETGFFVKGDEGVGILGDDELHQQVPVSKVSAQMSFSL